MARDVNTQAGAGIQALVQARAMRGNSGFQRLEAAPDPAEILRAQLAIEGQAAMVNEKKIAEESARAEDRATKQVMLETILREREREQEQAMWKEQFETTSRAAQDADARAKEAAVEQARALAKGEAEIAKAAGDRAKEALSLRKQSMHKLHDMQRGISDIQTFVGSNLQSAANVLSTNYLQTMAAITESRAAAGSTLVRALESKDSRGVSDAFVPALSGFLEEDTPRAREALGATIQSMFIHAQGGLDGDEERFANRRSELADLIGPFGMASLKELTNEAALAGGILGASGELTNTQKSTQKMLDSASKREKNNALGTGGSPKTLQAFHAMLGAGVGRSVVEFEDPEAQLDAFLNQVTGIMADPRLEDAGQRKMAGLKLRDTFVQEVSKAYGLTREEEAELSGFFGAAISNLLPMDEAVRARDLFLGDAQLELEGLSAEGVVTDQQTTLQTFDAYLKDLAEKKLVKGVADAPEGTVESGEGRAPDAGAGDSGNGDGAAPE